MGERRLLIVTSGLRRGGAEALLESLLRRRAGAPARTAVLSLTETTPLAARLAEAGIPVECLELPRAGALLRARRAALRFARRHQPDLVLGWMYHGCLAASWCARRLGAPAVWSIHGSLDDWRFHRGHTRLAIRMAARRSPGAAGICYASARARAQHEAAGFRADRGIVISPGVDASRFHASAGERRRRRATIGVGDDVLVIGHVARFHPVKDQRTLVAAAGGARQQGVPVHLLLAGAGLEPGNPQLARWLERAGLTARCTLLGSTDEVPGWLAACDLFALPSRAESAPVALLEAMAAELPCIVTDVGACAEIIGPAGAVVPVGRPDATAAAMLRLHQAGPAGRAALGRLARGRVIGRYGIEQALTAYARVLAAAAGDGAAAAPLASAP